MITGAEEKQRVPKPPPAPPKVEPDKPASNTSSDEDGGGDFFSSCLADCAGNCLEGIFESMWSGMFSRKQSSLAPADSSAATGGVLAGSLELADTTQVAPEYEPAAWAQYDVGYLRGYVPGDSVVLRRGPADPDSLRLEAGRLPDGTRVLVSATHVGPGGTMLEVRAVNEQGRSGWVHEKLVRRTPPAAASEPETLTPEPAPQATPPSATNFTEPAPAARAGERWAVMLAGGAAVIDNPELDAEYSDGGGAVEAEYLHCLPRAWALGAGVGYRGFSGKPQVEYVGASEIDAPQYSRFRLTYAVAEFGQRHAWAQGLRVGYMAGPVVGFVFEDATVRVLDAATRVPIGGRHERLGRWAGGGGATAWVGVALPVPLELGLRVRVLGFTWAGRHEKSLTSDYTDPGLLHLDAAITLTHAGR